jgi:hypothetical protein
MVEGYVVVVAKGVDGQRRVSLEMGVAAVAVAVAFEFAGVWNLFP